MQKLLLIFLLFTSKLCFAQSKQSSTDSIVWQASKKYTDLTFFKRILLGRNYRKEWETPVKLPIFHLDQKGFKITELGGGNQTKSLEFEDQQGREWVLRTIDKDVTKALPKGLQGTLAQRVVQDMVSAAHPYAPPTIPPIAKALELSVPEPVIYYVPDDPAFGEYRSIFANTVCLLERREPTPDDSKTDNTDKMFEEVLHKNDHLVLQHNLLRARLLDMLIADWDRHADQWRWGKKVQNGIEYYYGIPRDRDQAYFFSNGLLVRMAQKVSAKHFVGFRSDLDKLNDLNFKSWKFDKLFLNSLDAQDWDSTIRFVQTKLTDDLIHQSFLQMPPEVYAISGPEMERKLIERRGELLKKGMRYYRFLSKVVMVNGTDEDEMFLIEGNKDLLKVQVYALKEGKRAHLMYEREFTRKETWQIQFQGFDGNDQFIVSENADSNIRLLFKGGKGKDTYNIKGKVKNTIEDDKLEDNQLVSLSCTRNRIE